MSKPTEFCNTLIDTAIPPQINIAKRITICTTQKKPLSCAYPGSNIAVTGVFWGRTSADVCPSDDGDTRLDCEAAAETEGIVKGKCEGKESCELEARHALLQNPNSQHCPGVNKYLTVNYTCVPEDKEVFRLVFSPQKPFHSPPNHSSK